MNIESSGEKDYNRLNFAWELTDNCTLNCEYCYAHEYNKQNNGDIQNWKSVINKLSKIDQDFYIEIIGGEPTEHKELYQIISALCFLPNCLNVDIITNFIKPIKYWETYDKIEFNKVSICASYHPEYSDKFKYIHKVLNISKSFKYIKIQPNINIVDKKKYFESTKKVFDKFIKEKIEYGYNFINDVSNYYTTHYNQEFYKYFEDVFHIMSDKRTDMIPFKIDGEVEYKTELDIYKNKLNMFKDYTCNSLSFIITNKGLIKNACNGSLVLRLKDIKKTKIICPRNLCSCGFMFKYYKTKSRR